MTQNSAVGKSISFIGAGAMAEALASGWISKGVISPEQVSACDPARPRRDVFEALGATVYESAALMCKGAPDVLIVATKPQYVETVLSESASSLTRTLVVSIAAGKTLDSILKSLSKDARVIRVMPNTPCMVGESAAAMCRGGAATDEDVSLIKHLFGAVGVIEEVPENLISAVTGVSGSGPAYVYMIIEAMADGGVRAGLPRATALRLAAQTVVGGGKMVLQKGHPGVLKDLVTSPGGTTIAGVNSLENSGVRAAMMNAVAAASARAEELSKL